MQRKQIIKKERKPISIKYEINNEINDEKEKKEATHSKNKKVLIE